MYRYSTAVIVLTMLSGCAVLQEAFQNAKEIVTDSESARLPDAIRSGPPITTDLRDAEYGEACLDVLQPHDSAFEILEIADVNSEAGFELTPGFYRLETDVYLLQTEKYGALEGAAYLYAPLQGPRADLIESILRNAVFNPDISQVEVQSLVMCVALGLRYSDLPAELQLLASRLMSSMDRFAMNGGLFGLAKNRHVNKLLGDLPQRLDELAQEEEKLRSQIESAYHTAQDAVETATVLMGGIVNNSPHSYVPHGRWSRHPGGYFVRYSALPGAKLRFDIFVPRELVIDEDGKLLSIGAVDFKEPRLWFAAEVNAPRVVEFYPSRHVAVPANPGCSMLVAAGVGEPVR